MDTDTTMALSQGPLSLEDLKAFETPAQLFRALDYAEMDVQQQIVQLEAAINKISGSSKENSSEAASAEVVTAEATDEEDMESSGIEEGMCENEQEEKDENGAEQEQPQIQEEDALPENQQISTSTTPSPFTEEITKIAQFFITMCLLQISEGRVIDAQQTIQRCSAFLFLTPPLSSVSKISTALSCDDFQAAYRDLREIADKDEDATVVWAASQAFFGAQKMAHQFLLDCYKVIRADTAKELLHVETLDELHNEWEEFDKDGVTYLKRRDDLQYGPGYHLQLKELVAITQQLQQKGLYDDLK